MGYSPWGCQRVGHDGANKTTKPFYYMSLVAQVYLNLCDPMDCSPPGFSAHGGILQARILEWVAMPSFRRSSQLKTRIQVSLIAGRFFTICATREAHSIIKRPIIILVLCTTTRI